jgi:hypothetical protein
LNSEIQKLVGRQFAKVNRVILIPVVPFMVTVRLFIWLVSTYALQSVRGAELGIVGFSVVVAASHIFVLKMAEKAD